jgi:hypothetical protein
MPSRTRISALALMMVPARCAYQAMNLFDGLVNYDPSGGLAGIRFASSVRPPRLRTCRLTNLIGTTTLLTLSGEVVAEERPRDGSREAHRSGRWRSRWAWVWRSRPLQEWRGRLQNQTTSTQRVRLTRRTPPTPIQRQTPGRRLRRRTRQTAHQRHPQRRARRPRSQRRRPPRPTRSPPTS